MADEAEYRTRPATPIARRGMAGARAGCGQTSRLDLIALEMGRRVVCHETIVLFRREGEAMKLLELVNTDPLAQGALVGLVAVLIVTIGIFGFVLTRRNPPRT